MTIAEAEKAFNEMLPVETISPDISSGKIRRYEKPTGLLIERHDSLLTKMFLIFPCGEKSIVRYQIEMLKLSEV